MNHKTYFPSLQPILCKTQKHFSNFDRKQINLMMKTFTLFFLIVSISSFILYGCSKSPRNQGKDNTNKPENDTTANYSVTTVAIVEGPISGMVVDNNNNIYYAVPNSLYK